MIIRADGSFAGLRGYDAKAVSVETSIDTGRLSIVQQHLKDEVDINTIVRRFGITGQKPFGDAAGVYGDFTGIDDYESALAAIGRARDGFMTLPPEVRERFGNDPGELIKLAQVLSLEDFRAEVMGEPEAPVAAAGAAAVPVAAAAAPVVPAKPAV